MHKQHTSEFEKTRANLLELIKNFREQDFFYKYDGISIIEHLLNLCHLEQKILNNKSQRITTSQNRDLLSQENHIMPPQVIHHLASLRHETLNRLQKNQNEYTKKEVSYKKLLDEEEKIIDKITKMSTIENKGQN